MFTCAGVSSVVMDLGDVAIVDPLDQVAQGCESVQVADAVSPPTNAPPLVAPVVAPATPVTTVTANRVAPRSVSLRIRRSPARSPSRRA